ncbi:MAG: metallophosphoesterase [Bryobacteraceae bacterium]
MKLLVFSDIHSDLRALEKLMAIEADYYFAAGDLVSWARGLDKAGPILAKRAGRVWVLSGNHESPASITAFCAQYGLEDFHGKTLRIGDWNVAGLGCSAPTPFNTPGEYGESEFRERLAPFAGLSPLILICHSPPHNSRLDCAGPGQHFGSHAIGEFIQAEQPAWFFCGHIHEAEGVKETFGATSGVNVGKRGYLLDLATV